MERVFQRKRVDALACRAIMTTRRKRWIGKADQQDRVDGEKPVPAAPGDIGRRLRRRIA